MISSDLHELSGPYATIVADPPWKYNTKPTVLRSGGRGAGAEHHYPTMSNEALSQMPVEELSAEEAHLYLWTTNPRLIAEHGRKREVTPFDICEAWGFKPMTILTWVKPGANGTGWYFRGSTEHVIFATRGGLGIPSDKRRRNVIEAKRSRHSSKPDEFFDLVEAVSPAPRLEMFARRERNGWDAFGNEVEPLAQRSLFNPLENHE